MKDVARLLDALAFASQRHSDQRRKDASATPYINHPIAVARLLAVEGNVEDLDVLIAAVLHDTVEDTDTTAQELELRFGNRVAEIVKEVTDDKSLPKSVRKQLQIDNAPHKSEEAALVKLADKCCNLQDVAEAPPSHWSLERRSAYADWAAMVVARLPVANEALLAAFSRNIEGSL